jgi:alginate biosynthesis protein AlgX
LKIEKPETSDTDGRFAFEMRDDQDWPQQNLLALEIQGPEAGAAPQKVEAKVCKRNVFPGVNTQHAQAGL